MTNRRLIIFSAVMLIAVFTQLAVAKSSVQAATSYCNWVFFVADVSVPDGTTFKTGEAFTKVWRLKNVGTCQWTTYYQVVFVSGSSLSTLAQVSLPRAVNPGETVDVSVAMQAPSTPGRQKGYWQMKAADGTLFGLGPSASNPFWVDINVSGDPGFGYDFADNVCAATWRSGAGILPCPNANDNRGFATRIATPRLEDYSLDSVAGILVYPQQKYDGYIQGTYPEFTVQPGDHFKTAVGCEYGKSCYVTFRLEYQIGNSANKILWKWSEKNEGKIYNVDVDLGSLAGKTVKFTLTLLATGSATNDFAIWGHPKITRSGAIPPTVTPSNPTPTPTPVTPVSPTSLPGTFYDFVVNVCSANWKSGAGTLPCPGTDGDARGFTWLVNNPRLENGSTDYAPGLVLAPQNKYDGYIQGTYPEITIQAGDRFQGRVGCAYGSACYVTFRLGYQIGNGGIVTLWSWKEKNEGQSYLLNKDLSALAGKKVKFILTLLATGPATNDRALWSQPRLVRPGYEASRVVGATVEGVKPAVITCGGPNPVSVFGSITTNAPMTVTYHVELSGDTNVSSANRTLTFTTAGTQTITPEPFSMDCGNYTAKVVITSPNGYSAATPFAVFPPSATPSPAVTPNPNNSVTAVTTGANLLQGSDCALTPNLYYLFGTITTNGPTTVKYYWEVIPDGAIRTPEQTLTLTTAATAPVSYGNLALGCGAYAARLVVTSPNSMTAQTNLEIYPPTSTPTPTVTVTPTPTVTPTQGTLLGPYAVVQVTMNDVLNVRSGPGVNYAVISSFGNEARDIYLTGKRSGVWAEVQLPGGGTGWVNSYYLTEQVSSSTFCADARVTNLIGESLKQAMLNSNGTLFGSIVSPTHGLDIRNRAYGNLVHLNQSGARMAFVSDAVYSWGGGPSGMDTIGTFAAVIQPRVTEVLSANYQLTCNVATHNASIPIRWSPIYTNLNFYEVYKPGTPGIELDFRTWLIGIDYVNGAPYIMVMIQFEWEP